MKRIVLGMLAIAVMSVASSVSAFAGYTGAGGSLTSGSFFSSTPGTGGDLHGPITVTDLITSFNPVHRAGDFDSVTPGSTFFNGTYNFTGSSFGASQTFTSALNYGSFGGNVSADDKGTVGTDGQSRSISITGTFTPDSALGTLPLPSRAGVLILTFSKATAGGSITASWALDTTSPPSAVPEPTSIAIFGLGAVGFAARRFRRK